jgi:hypothetical protein
VGVTLDVRCRLAAAAGQEVSLKLFPVSSVPLRDSGQIELAMAIAGAADRSWRARFEVPTGPGPLHAADVVLDRPDEVVHVEIERRIVDFQAQWRSIELKRASHASRESRPVRVVVAVPDTASMRTRIQENADLVARVLPLRSRALWRAIRTGSSIGGDGLLLVRRGGVLTRPGIHHAS